MLYGRFYISRLTAVGTSRPRVPRKQWGTTSQQRGQPSDFARSTAARL